jgi:REP element-mobilizing transposase RayT
MESQILRVIPPLLTRISHYPNVGGGLPFATSNHMGRRPRLQFPGAVYHVMSRGNRKSVIFSDEDDRDSFMKIFAETAETYAIRAYATCPMGTHYHLVIDTPRGNLSAAMRQLNAEYSKYFNRRYHRTGHTFEARFQSIVVQRERYLRRVVRYVVRNPVEAHLCHDVADWRWTTYRATAGLEECPDWLHVDWIDWAFRASSRAEAQSRYRTYVKLNHAPLTSLDEKSYVIGTPRFQRSLLSAYQPTGDRPLPRHCSAVIRVSLPVLFGSVDDDIRSRDAAILVAHRDQGYSLSQIATFLGLKPSSASKALKRVRGNGRQRP